MASIKKVVFPVAGLGTRMLPATRVLPKEMLPVVDKPIIQYALEEAAAAGAEQFIFVTGRGKTLIEDHFDRAFELFETLTRKRKDQELGAPWSIARQKPARWSIPVSKSPRGSAMRYGVQGMWWVTNPLASCLSMI